MTLLSFLVNCTHQSASWTAMVYLIKPQQSLRQASSFVNWEDSIDSKNFRKRCLTIVFLLHVISTNHLLLQCAENGKLSVVLLMNNN